ncbi:MAG: hypothetical protein R2856_26090 [Caldilineaceae bacterium]
MPTTRAGDTMPAMLNTVIRSSDRTGWLISLGLALAALLWWAGLSQRVASPTPTAEIFGALGPGHVARMDSPVFVYSPGWRVDAGAPIPANRTILGKSLLGVSHLTTRAARWHCSLPWAITGGSSLLQ